MLYPQMNAARTLLDLNGLWGFFKDEAKVGENEKWFDGLPSTRDIYIPASWNEQYNDLYLFNGVAWYEKTFTLPKHQELKKTFLRIGSVFYSAKVWLNGYYFGEHVGGHLPFEFDVSSKLIYGDENRLTIRIDATINGEQLPPGTINHIDGVFGYREQFPPITYDFFPYGGIHRPVYLYTTSEVYIQDIAVRTELQGETARIYYAVNLNTFSNFKVTLKTAEQQEIHYLEEQATLAGQFTLPNPQLWEPAHPYLYNLIVQLSNGKGELLDEYKLAYGVREIKLAEGRLWLNGKAIFLKGFGKHEDFDVIGKGLNQAVIVKDFDLLKWVGANSVRTSHYPYAEEFLDYADRQGILVISETPFVGLSDKMLKPDILEQAKSIIKQLIQRDKNHPSVIMWSLANEPKVETEHGEYFFKEMYQHAKSLDSTRPITYAACLGPAQNRGLKYYDLIALNKYYGWYELPGQPEKAQEKFERELEDFHSAFNKPILVTEFGADAVAGMHSITPQMFTEEYQTDLIERYYHVIKSKNYCIGAHVWAFADFRTAQAYTRVINNRKGVFTRDRQPKLAAHLLKKLWKE